MKHIDRIEQDTERDFFMSAHEAKDYGLIDQVIDKRSIGNPAAAAAAAAI